MLLLETTGSETQVLQPYIKLHLKSIFESLTNLPRIHIWALIGRTCLHYGTVFFSPLSHIFPRHLKSLLHCLGGRRNPTAPLHIRFHCHCKQPHQHDKVCGVRKQQRFSISALNRSFSAAFFYSNDLCFNLESNILALTDDFSWVYFPFWYFSWYISSVGNGNTTCSPIN